MTWRTKNDVWHKIAPEKRYVPFAFSTNGDAFVEHDRTRIKEHLLLECNLHTIVRLPNGVFNRNCGTPTPRSRRIRYWQSRST